MKSVQQEIYMIDFSRSIFVLAYLSVTGNNDQIYNDIIVEFTSKYSSNKSVERQVLLLPIFWGIAAYGVCYLITQNKWKDRKPAAIRKQLDDV